MKPADQLGCRAGPSDERFDSDEDLRDREGFDDIVIAAGMEPGHPVVHSIEGGEEQYWGMLALGAKGLTDVPAIGVGQTDIDYEDVNAVGPPKRPDRIVAVPGDQDVVVVHVQGIGQDTPNGFVVFTDAHSRHVFIVHDERGVREVSEPCFAGIQVAFRLVGAH
jgi:hypothetical protein